MTPPKLSRSCKKHKEPIVAAMEGKPPISDHKYVIHATYTGTGCATCGRPIGEHS